MSLESFCTRHGVKADECFELHNLKLLLQCSQERLQELERLLLEREARINA